MDRLVLEAHFRYFIKNLSTEKKFSALDAEILNIKSEIAVESTDKGLKIRDNPRFPIRLSRDQHETHLPALENTPRANTRLFGPHENPWWPRRHQRPSRQRPQTPGCLSRLTGGVEKITHRSDFDAVMAAGVAATTPHFALHQQTSATTDV